MPQNEIDRATVFEAMEAVEEKRSLEQAILTAFLELLPDHDLAIRYRTSQARTGDLSKRLLNGC